MGVHSRSLGPIFAEALRLTGVKRAWVVCGDEGLDEISPAGLTYVRLSLLLYPLLRCTDQEHRSGAWRRMS